MQEMKHYQELKKNTNKIKINEIFDNAMEKLKKQDIAAGTIRNAIKSKQARTKLKQNKALKPISETVVSDMQNQIRKQQEPFINAGIKIQKVVRGHDLRK